jgi:hypothetical protein
VRYAAAAGQLVQNWQSLKKLRSCYEITMTAQDGST